MKYSFTLILAALVTIASAQRHNFNYSSPKSSDSKSASLTNNQGPKQKNITGIWKGYFVQSGFGFGDDRYRFEVQIADQENHSLTSVTYSYKTTVFYGKAEANGIFTPKTDNVLLKEVKLVDVKVTDKNTNACLMTCYMDYSKMGSLETLSGTYTSVSLKDKSDCGSGKVYLEKSPTTDFYKEDFVAKREAELKKKEKALAKKPAPTPKESVAKTNTAKPTVKPGQEENLITRSKPKEQPQVVLEPKKDEEPRKTINPPAPVKISKPEIMKTRENDLQKTVYVHEKEFKIELYDNGQIDGDRITVYHNNEKIVSNQQLTDKPITFTIKVDNKSEVHEFVMVAENLGSIPPNTALMIITAGSQRHEVFVTSNEQKNAVVKVVYKEKQDEDDEKR